MDLNGYYSIILVVGKKQHFQKRFLKSNSYST